MATLKELRNRIASVKATQKITSAMKMVAASKLRRAQEAAEAARPYADRMARMVDSLAASVAGDASAPALLRGTGGSDTHLIVVATSDRGLCGGFNSTIVRAVRARIAALEDEGRTVRLLIVGRKGRDQLRRDHGERIVEALEGVGARGVAFADAAAVADNVARRFAAGEFDVCTIYYNRFRSAVSQVVTPLQLVPLARGGDAGEGEATTAPTQAARCTSSSRTRSPSSSTCCRATWRCRSSAPCSRTRPANRAHG